jgi:hypothetical protein
MTITRQVAITLAPSLSLAVISFNAHATPTSTSQSQPGQVSVHRNNRSESDDSFSVGGSPAKADQLSTIIRLWEETFDRMK